MAINWNRDLFNRYDPPSEELFAQFESELGCPLPEDFREFLRHHNGGDFRCCPETIPDLFPEEGFRPSFEYLYGLSPEVEPEHDLRGDLISDLAPKYLAIASGLWVGMFIATFGGKAGNVFLRHEGKIRFFCESIWDAASLFENYKLDEQDVWQTLPPFQMIERGDETAFKTYLEEGGDPNSMNETGDSLLFFACQEPYMFRMLLAYGAVFGAPNARGRTALHEAAMWSIDAVRELVEAGADPNAKDDVGFTPLMCATAYRTFKYLIENGADIQAIDNEGGSVFRRESRSCRLLEELGYDIDSEIESIREKICRFPTDADGYEIDVFCREVAGLEEYAVRLLPDMRVWNERLSPVKRLSTKWAIEKIRSHDSA